MSVPGYDPKSHAISKGISQIQNYLRFTKAYSEKEINELASKAEVFISAGLSEPQNPNDITAQCSNLNEIASALVEDYITANFSEETHKRQLASGRKIIPPAIGSRLPQWWTTLAPTKEEKLTSMIQTLETLFAPVTPAPDVKKTQDIDKTLLARVRQQQVQQQVRQQSLNNDLNTLIDDVLSQLDPKQQLDSKSSGTTASKNRTTEYKKDSKDNKPDSKATTTTASLLSSSLNQSGITSPPPTSSSATTPPHQLNDNGLPQLTIHGMD